MYHVYNLAISATSGAPYIVVNLSPDQGGPTNREAAIAFAQAEAAKIGWGATRLIRVTWTPTGGYSVSLERA